MLGTFFCIWAIEVTNGDPFEEYTPELLTLILGVSWFIGLQFLIEQQTDPKKWNWLKLGLCVLLFFFYYYVSQGDWWNENPVFYIRFALYMVAGHLFILFSPFLKQWNANAYWNFLKDLSISLLRSGFFALILYLGLVLALVAIDALFNADIDSKRYGQLFVFCLGIVNTWIYLTDFPKNIRSHTTIEFQKALEVLVKFILIPLVLLYLAILYAYSLKIVIDWDLPKGWVSNLVIALAFLGLAIQIIINPIRNSITSWTINRFQPWFYLLLLPMIVLLFVSIFRRTLDYGITENRYFVFLIAFWILAITLYMLLAKKKRLIVLPVSLFVLAMGSSFGFWGAVSVSERSQVAQFEKTLNKVMHNDKKATNAQLVQLKSIITYLSDRNMVNALDGITKLNVNAIVIQKDQRDSLAKPYIWTDAQLLIDTLGIELDQKSKDALALHEYYSLYGEQSGTFMDITGFNDFTEIVAYPTEKFVNTRADIRFRLGLENMRLDIDDTTATRALPTLDLKPVISKLVLENKPKAALTHEDLTVIVQNDSVSARFIINELEVRNHQNTLSLTHVKGYLFLKNIAGN